MRSTWFSLFVSQTWMQAQGMPFAIALKLNTRPRYAQQAVVGSTTLDPHRPASTAHINMLALAYHHLGQQLFAHPIDSHQFERSALSHRTVVGYGLSALVLAQTRFGLLNRQRGIQAH